MRRFRLPNHSVVSERALRNLLDRLRPALSIGERGDTRSISVGVLEVLDKFFDRLGKPHFQHKKIRPSDPVVASEFNDKLKIIVDDLNTGYEEIDRIRDASISVHNFESLHAAELKKRADDLSSMVADLRLVSGQLGEEVLVFSDNFVDESKLDSSFPLETLEAQIIPGQGSLTLFRNGAVSIGVGEAEVKVNPIGVRRDANADNTGRFYEGHFYSFLGDAEPEGGTFHFTEQLDESSIAGITQQALKVPIPPEKLEKGSSNADRKEYRKKLKQYKRDIKDFVAPGGKEEKFLEELQAGLFEDKLNKPKKTKHFIERQRKKNHRKDRVLRKQYMFYAQNPDIAAKDGIDLDSDIPLGPENYVLMDIGAGEDELIESRARMLDGDPSSYWQCELVRTTNVIQNEVDKLSENTDNANIDANELRQLAESAQVDKEDFDVELIFVLKEPRQLNWITLTPITFDDGAYMEVVDLSTSPSMEDPFVQVESFSSKRYSNILTEEANEELTSEDTSYLLAPNKYSYRGVGVWPFTSREVQQVKIKVRQKSPVPNPYERIVMEITRTHTSKIK